jgi:hypothetical protein
VIPSTVDSIDPPAFNGCALSSVTLAEGNLFYRLEGGFLRTADGSCLVRYLGSDSIVCIPRDLIIIGPNSFDGNQSVSILIFESGSLLHSIDEFAFASTRLYSLCLPRSTTFVAGSAFWNCPII